MPPNQHALLSASSAHRWMGCTPSARLEQEFADQESEAAAEGSAAHALAEHKLRKALKLRSRKPVSKYDCDEMDDYTTGYVEFVMEALAEAKLNCPDPQVLIEQKLDFSCYVPDGCGTGDCLIVASPQLHVIDFKYGLGVLVDAYQNPQMMLYALGALRIFDCLYDITEVAMTIYQPRRENVSTWTISVDELREWAETTLKRFADGKVSMPYKQFLGYEKGSDGLPKIVPEQAETVRYIYDLFMSGKTITAIAKQLTAEGIPTPGGKEKWVGRTVESILTNEKYKGDARLQKKFTVDFLQKKMKVNEGEVPQYYVENSHEAIIDPLLFDRVQEEMARRKALGRSYSGKTIFSCRLICGDCGHYLGSKVWNSTNKYRRVIWQCNNKFKGECKCGTPHLTEEFIKAKFLEAYNQLLPDRERLIEDCRVIQAELTDCTDIDREIHQLLEELEVVAELTKRCVDENSSTALDQGDYLARYNGLVERYDKAQDRVKELERKRTERMAKADAIGGFMFRLRELDQPMDHFDERLWLDVIDCVVVHRDGLTIKFQNGKEIRV